MRAGTLEVSNDLLALGDQVDDFHLEVRKCALERTDPALCDRRELAARDLIQNVKVPLSETGRLLEVCDPVKNYAYSFDCVSVDDFTLPSGLGRVPTALMTRSIG
jgi:hypothetical protein